ncbi:hypothetical protein [Candidatus Palauibacter sp.]|uniref:hypothetical protein n=1 Tax=Candidatus Palauibacter sp. TaxID=3101350 RepID=UPI003B023BA5
MSNGDPVADQTEKVLAEMDRLIEMELVLAFLDEAGHVGLTRWDLRRKLKARGRPPKGRNPLWYLLEHTLYFQISKELVGGEKRYWLTKHRRAIAT